MRKVPTVRDAPSAGRDCRCACGSLMARLVDGGVELKCRRCKQTTLVPLVAGEAGMPRPRSVAARGG